MRTCISLAITIALAFLTFATEQAQAQIFSGQATGVQATVTTGGAPGVTTAVSDTGPLPSGGGAITVGSASANIAGIVTAGASTVSTSGSGTTSQSAASIGTVDINLAGVSTSLRVRADAVSSNTTCTCGNIVCSGSSTILNLRVGDGAGTVINVTGAPNQTVVVNSGTQTLTLIINEQITSPASLTFNALHAIITDMATAIRTDVIVSSSHSDVRCLTTSFDRYSGRGTGVRFTLTTAAVPSSVTSIIADTGPLPTSGGNIFTAVTSANIAAALSTGVVTSMTSGGEPGGNVDTSQSSSRVNNLTGTFLGGVAITATVIQSNTQCVCGTAPPLSCSGSSVLTNLVVTVGGVAVPITITGAPNQVVALPAGLGTLTINEQVSGGLGDLTVSALHLSLATTDLVVARSHSDIMCSLQPTAGGVSISGRVITASGDPISRARVTLTGADGTVLSGITNPFGYYIVDDVPVGSTYLAEVSHKLHSFDSRTISVSDSITDFDFVAGLK